MKTTNLQNLEDEKLQLENVLSCLTAQIITKRNLLSKTKDVSLMPGIHSLEAVRAQMHNNLAEINMHIEQEKNLELVALKAAARFGLEQKQSRSKGAAAMHANSPKQADKATVREYWTDWQDHPNNRDGTKKYKSKAAFARMMLDKFPSLESQKVITDRWIPMWEKENTPC